MTSANVTISSFKYTYDNGGNPKSALENDGSRVTWTYDAANQLKSERRTGTGAFSYTLTYDAVGNVTQKNVPTDIFLYQFDAANQATRAISVATIATFSYDQAGNQTRERNIVYTTTLTWDDENRVKRNRSLVSGGSVSPNTLTYTGDGLLARLDQFNGTVIKPVWDGQNILLEQNASDVTQVVNTLEPAGYGNLISHKRGSAKRYYLFNRIGTTDRLIDDSQTTTDIYLLDAFGGGVSLSGSTVNPYRFIGQLGYYYYQTGLLNTATWVRARHYEPTYRRWLSVDDIGFRMLIWTGYDYSSNAPTTRLDPSGWAYCLALYNPHDNNNMCFAREQCPNGARDNSKPLGLTGLWNPWDCINDLHIHGHGAVGVGNCRIFGKDGPPNIPDSYIDDLCKRLCKNADVHIWTCGGGSGEDARRILQRCPKVRKVYGCLGLTNSPQYAGTGQGGADRFGCMKRDPACPPCDGPIVGFGQTGGSGGGGASGSW